MDTIKYENDIYYAIPGYLNYFISKVTLEILSTVNQTGIPRVLNLKVSSTGYRTTTATIDGKHKELSKHRAVALTFIHTDKDVSLLHVNHIDGNKLNNNIPNFPYQRMQSRLCTTLDQQLDTMFSISPAVDISTRVI